MMGTLTRQGSLLAHLTKQLATPPPLSPFPQPARFAPLASHQIKSRLEEVATAEKVKTTDDGIGAILDLANGDMRRVMNLLQSTR